jgi:hypothetical protein
MLSLCVNVRRWRRRAQLDVAHATDALNAVVPHPSVGGGLAYCTRSGDVRLFTD